MNRPADEMARHIDEAMDHAVALAALAAEGRVEAMCDLLGSLDADERRALLLAGPMLAASYAAQQCAASGMSSDRVPGAIRAGLVRVRGES